MSNTTTTTASGGIGFFGLLFIAFLVLKLTHVIDWSWWWITAPLAERAGIVFRDLVDHLSGRLY